MLNKLFRSNISKNVSLKEKKIELIYFQLLETQNYTSRFSIINNTKQENEIRLYQIQDSERKNKTALLGSRRAEEEHEYFI